MKKLIALLLALVMVFGLVACGNKTPEAAPEVAPEAAPEVAPEAEKEPVTLTVWYYEREGMNEVYEAWADEVNAAYPWISMEFEVLPWDSGPEKFTVACATGTTPDIYVDGYSRIAPAVNAGLAVDLTDVIEANADKFIAETADGVVDGKNYYIADKDGASYGILVNMDLANKLGVADLLPADKETWSYEDYLNICRKAKAADPNVIPSALFAGNQSSDCWYYSWFMGNGAQLTNEGLTEVVVNQGENKTKITETLTLFETLVDEHLVADGCATLTDDDMISLWHAGRLLFMAGGLNEIAVYYANQEAGTSLEFEIDACALPTAAGTGAGTGASWGSSGLTAFGNNGNEEAIKLALDVYLKNNWYTKRYIELNGGMPRMKDISIEYATEELSELMAWAADFSAKHNTSAFGILEPWWTDFRGTFYPQLQDFFAGNIDSATMLENWKVAGDAVISAANAG